MLCIIFLFHLSATTMDNELDRVNHGTYSTVVLLILFFTTMTIIVKQSEALPPGCKPCDAADMLKGLAMRIVCYECGNMYGPFFEHCCLCSKPIYKKCVAALEK